uniref:VQ domain-containing protein n=1 Tax=Hordeum vulgare subsp. vulgare TaxID=112509 RepID=A0A8I6XA59_HORVV
MDRNPRTPAPRVYTRSRHIQTVVRADASNLKEVVQRLTGQPVAANTVVHRHGATAEDVEMVDAEEEKAIKEGRFYLHPSLRSVRCSCCHREPKLLPLFPVTPSHSD